MAARWMRLASFTLARPNPGSIYRPASTPFPTRRRKFRRRRGRACLWRARISNCAKPRRPATAQQTRNRSPPRPGRRLLIQILPRVVGRARVAVLGPTYAEHAAAWTREGHHVYEVETLAKALDGAQVIVAVNPNNPTGRIIPAEDLRWAARALDQRGGLLVVDEAFMDVIEPCQSVIPAFPPSTVVLRSFGKTYGLAGVRLGFAVAAEGIATRLRDLLGPWAVSGPAIAIGRAALADDAWLAEARRRLGGDAESLDAILKNAGCELVGGTPLFRLAAHARAQELAGKLGERGILVRRFSEEPAWLRFGIPGGETAWFRLQAALAA